jgi:hypothetical protein
MGEMTYLIRKVAKCRNDHKKSRPDNSELCRKCKDKFFCVTNGKLSYPTSNFSQKERSRYAFEVPNDTEGIEFLRLAHKFLNSFTWTLRKRGRNPDRKGVLGALYQRSTTNDIRISEASWYAVYLDEKKRKNEQ